MTVEVRELTAQDAGGLQEFFAAMPAADRTFFWEDVTDPAVGEAWARDDRRVRRCATDGDGAIVAFAALLPGTEYSSHVAQVVLVVAPDARRLGLGLALARAMLLEALQREFKKVTVTIAADSPGAIAMFQGIGFEPEALLRDQLRSPEDGTLRDLVILAHMVEDGWAGMLSGGLDEAMG